MANPLILFENRYEDATPTATSEASGFPVTNITNWRMDTTYRWKATGTGDQSIEVNIGSAKGCDTLAIAGHNLGTVAGRVKLMNGAAPTPATEKVAAFTPTDDLPIIKTFNQGTARQYWRLLIDNTPSAAAQIGIIVIGRRIDFDAGALEDLDPYNRSSSVEPFINNKGSPIGVSVRSKTKRFQMSYAIPGMLATSFFTTITPDIDTGFLPHAVDSAKPFFFNWNIGVDPDENYLCRVDGPTVAMPFAGSTARRGFQTTFIAHREAS